jgi:predicted lipoprotein
MFNNYGVLFVLAFAFGMPGCKLVKNTPDAEKAIPVGASGDDARNALRIEKTFDSKLVPHIIDSAQPLATLKNKLAEGLDAAGVAFGKRGSGAGSAWNFAVEVTGTVVETKLDTRARTAGLDADADGSADITIQLGPVVKGTTLRDVAPFYKFDDFRDQIEYAKLARALNAQAVEMLKLPEGDLIGITLKVTGVLALRSPTGSLLVTPLVTEILP